MRIILVVGLLCGMAPLFMLCFFDDDATLGLSSEVRR
jgi:hypothetical protein